MALAEAAAEIPTPSCAEGPTREEDVIVGTDCADHIVVPPSVAYVDGGPGNDTIVAAESTATTRAEACATPPHCGVGSQEFVGAGSIMPGGEGLPLLHCHVLRERAGSLVAIPAGEQRHMRLPASRVGLGNGSGEHFSVDNSGEAGRAPG